MKTNLEVDRWFADMKPPAEQALRRVRDIVMRADPRMTEYVKNRTVVFGYEGDFASFVQYNKPQANVMFNRGARIPGKFPHLEGTHASARFMRFKDVAEVQKRADELGRLAQAWCAMVEPAAVSSRASSATSRSRRTPASARTSKRPGTSPRSTRRSR
jgi:hypothetical protein